MKVKKELMCENCKEKKATHELAGCKSCEDCLMEYWRDNDIGLDTSFDDFLNYTCSKLK